MTARADRPRGARPEDPAPARPLPWRPVTVTLLGLSLALTLLSLSVPLLLGRPYADYDHWLRHYLDVGRESNLPTWWSASLLLAAGIAYLAVAVLSRRERPRTALAWTAFAGLLLLFSADEASLIHDRARHLTDLLLPDNEIFHAWIVVGIPLALVIVVGAVILSRALPSRSRRLLLLGLGIYFLGALGLETLHSVLDGHLEIGFVWVAIYHVEELLEMWGVVVMLAAVPAAVRYRRSDGGVVLTTLGPTPQPAPRN